MRKSVEAHLEEVGARLAQLTLGPAAVAPELLSLTDSAAVGRVIAHTIHAPIGLPLFDNSQMDGYAVRSSDLAGATAASPLALPIGFTTAAGDAPIEHVPGTASPIMTGAAVPHGSDSIVPIEQVLPPRFTSLSRAGDEPAHGTVSFTVQPPQGQFVRRASEDVAVGAVLATTGTRLTPARIGVLAASGITAVPLAPRLRVLLCSTGDEIEAGPIQQGLPEEGLPLPDQPHPTLPEPALLQPGRIYDANTPMLSAALHAAGACVQVLTCPDDPARFRRLLEQHAAEADLIVTTGGISAGAFEVVREALADCVSFGAIAMQPGGPQGLGELRHDTTRPATPVLCFPGNPVSAMLSAEIFLLPFLRDVAGLTPERRTTRLPLAHAVVSPVDKLQVRRGTIAPDGRVLLSPPGSHLLHDLAAADLLAFIPVGIDALDADAPIDTWSLHD